MNKNLCAVMAASFGQSCSYPNVMTTRSMNRFFKTFLLLFVLIWSSQIINAQNNGDVVLISDGKGNYLSVDASNTSEVTNLATPTEYSLWRVERSSSNCKFQNVKTGQYLTHIFADFSTWNFNALEMRNSGTSWRLSGGKLSVTRLIFFTYYIRFNNNKWETSSSSTTLTFTTMKERYDLIPSPSSLNFGKDGGLQTVNVTPIVRWTNASGSIVISLPYQESLTLSTSLSNTHFTATVNSAIVRVNAAANNGLTPLSDNLTITATNLNASVVVPITQTTISNFAHQKGHSGRELLPHGMQGVHTERIVNYFNPNDHLSLTFPLQSLPYSH